MAILIPRARRPRHNNDVDFSNRHSDGLSGFRPLNGKSDDIIEANGNPLGSPNWVNYDKGIAFEGTGTSYIRLDSATLLSKQINQGVDYSFAVSFRTTMTGVGYIYSEQRWDTAITYRIYINAGVIYHTMRDGGWSYNLTLSTGTDTFNDGEEHTIEITYDDSANYHALYVDGKFYASFVEGSTADFLQNSRSHFGVRYFSDDDTNKFVGEIYNAAYWIGKFRSDGEIFDYGTNPSQLLRTGKTYFPFPSSGGTTLDIDRISTMSWVADKQIDRISRISYIADLLKDSILILENLLTSNLDKLDHIAYTASTGPDIILVIDWVLNLASDRQIPIESLLEVLKDAQPSVENLLEVLKDAQTSIEWSGNLNSDNILELDWVLNILSDKQVPIESLLEVFRDRILNLSNKADLDLDRLVHISNLASMRSDRQAHADYGQGANLDKQFVISNLQDIQADSIIPVEWAGAAAVDVDALIQLDWLADKQIDNVVILDNTLLVKIDAEQLVAFDTSVGQDKSTPIDYVTDVQVTSQIQLEALLSLKIDANILAEYNVVVYSNNTIPVEWEGVSTIFMVGNRYIFTTDPKGVVYTLKPKNFTWALEPKQSTWTI